MKILHIIDSFDEGGAQELLLRILQNMDRKKYPSVVCCLKDTGTYSKEFEKLVEVKYLKLNNLNPLARIIHKIGRASCN